MVGPLLAGTFFFSARSHPPLLLTSMQFYLSESDVGKNRAEASKVKLAELNPRVDFQVHNGKLDDAFLKNFTVVVCTDSGLAELTHVGKFCHV